MKPRSPADLRSATAEAWVKGRASAKWVVVKIGVPFLGTLNSRCRITVYSGPQNGTLMFFAARCV